jgi:hypothetical protein
MEPRECVECLGPIPGFKRRDAVACSDRCRAAAHRRRGIRDAEARLRASDAAVRWSESGTDYPQLDADVALLASVLARVDRAPCWHCGRRFVRNRKNQRYCTPTCRADESRERHSAYPPEDKSHMVETRESILDALDEFGYTADELLDFPRLRPARLKPRSRRRRNPSLRAKPGATAPSRQLADGARPLRA